MIHSGFSRKHKRDATHAEIAEALESFGWSVWDTSKFGNDFPDMVIGLGGVTDLVEAKSGERARFSEGQKEFAEKWRGAKVVNLPSKQAAIEWATRTRHERRRQNDAKALAALPKRKENAA
jgi:hypothetical protein